MKFSIGMNAVIDPGRIRAAAGHSQHCGRSILCRKHTGHEGTDTAAETAQKYRI